MATAANNPILKRLTYDQVFDAHGTTSWLDHVICSSDMQNNVVSIEILDKSPSSDHLALAV